MTLFPGGSGATLEASYPNEMATGTDGNSDYFTLSGTSMATPAVAGAAALFAARTKHAHSGSK